MHSGRSAPGRIQAGSRLHAGASPWQSGFVTLDEKQLRLAKELAALLDAPARLSWLIEGARQRPMLPVELRLDANRVEGCMSRLWFVKEFRDGRCWFRSESDSLVVKSVAGLLCDFYNGQTPAEILKHPPDFLSAVGIPQYLTPNRRSTMGRVWGQIRAFAEKHASPLAGVTS
jgi:cysteine desulfuration protein SufE